MIVNIRGTNGSGKTTIVKDFLKYPSRAIFGLLGAKYPEAYQLTFGKGKKPLYVIGPYHSQTGGIDALSGRGV
jgi:hypothetical protein